MTSIHDLSGGAARELVSWRGRSRTLARDLGISELELFGMAVINPKIEEVLLRLGFERRTMIIPDDFGPFLAGDSVEILTKTFPVSGDSD